MSGGETVWLPGVVTLLVGLALGAVLAWNLRRNAAPATTQRPRKPVAPPVDSTAVADLEARRNTLVQQLRELDLDAGRRDAKALAAERDSLEREAAIVLRALDRAAGLRKAADEAVSTGPETPVAVPAAAAAAAAAGGSTLRGAFWGAASTAAVFGLILFVNQSATPRNGNMQITGGVPPGAAPMAAPGAGGEPEPHPNAPIEAPPDKAGRLELVRNLLGQDRYMEAFQVAALVLKEDPDDARALSYSAVVRLVMGQNDKAMELTERAVLHAQQQPEVWLTRGFVASRSGKWSAAVEAFERAATLGPALDEPLQKMLAAAREHVANKDPEVPPPREAAEAEDDAQGGDDAAPAAPMAAAAAPAQADSPPPAAGSPGIRGTITLAPSATPPAPGTTLFVYVRPDGVTGGPPAAVKRMQTGAFPIVFSVGPENSMMGQPFPQKATIEARVDSDGNAMTRGPGDLTARASGVSTPADGVVLEVAPGQ